MMVSSPRHHILQQLKDFDALPGQGNVFDRNDSEGVHMSGDKYEPDSPAYILLNSVDSWAVFTVSFIWLQLHGSKEDGQREAMCMFTGLSSSISSTSIETLVTVN